MFRCSSINVRIQVCVCVCWNLVLMRTRKRRGSQNNKVLIISAQHYGPGSYPHRHIAASPSSAQAKLQKKKTLRFCFMRFAFLFIILLFFVIFLSIFLFLDFYGLKFVLAAHKCHKLRLAQFVGQLISFVCGTLAAGICIAWYVVYLSVRYARVINYKYIYSRVDAWDCVVGEGWQTKYQSHCRYIRETIAASPTPSLSLYLRYL